MGFNSAFKRLKIVKNPGNGRLNNLNDPVLNVLNPICHLLALLGTRHILHVSRIRVKVLSVYIEGRQVNCKMFSLEFQTAFVGITLKIHKHCTRTF